MFERKGRSNLCFLLFGLVPLASVLGGSTWGFRMDRDMSGIQGFFPPSSDSISHVLKEDSSRGNIPYERRRWYILVGPTAMTLSVESRVGLRTDSTILKTSLYTMVETTKGRPMLWSGKGGQDVLP